MPMYDRTECPICNSEARHTIEVHGNLNSADTYSLRECTKCGYIFVQNPRTDYETLYNDEYYRGRGADPLVNYEWDAAHPDQTIRVYEWRAIMAILQLLGVDFKDSRCLDYGCGTGGLVLYANSICSNTYGTTPFYGYDTSSEYLCDGLDMSHILKLKDIDSYSNKFDAVTMIEVLEHLENPLDELRRVRKLMKKGGILFTTTGNADPWRSRLNKWNYIIPELHIGYFSPTTLSILYEKSGFSPINLPSGASSAMDDILTYKILKVLGFKRLSFWQKMIRFGRLPYFADRIYKVSRMPAAIAI